MNSKETYKHIDTDDTFISLHDCYVTEMLVKDDCITVYFDNGFWIMPEHELSKLTDTVRTDSSRVDFYFDQSVSDEISVYIFRENIFGKTIREQWDIQKLTELINTKSFSLEFLYQYKGGYEQLHDCWLHFQKKPYHYECQLRIPVTKVTYCWNNLCPDKKW